MVRHRLSDEEWNEIWDMFPERKTTGRPPKPAGEIMDGICWMLRVGTPWRDLPEEFSAWETVYAHFDRWTSDGTLARIFTWLQQRFSEDERFDHSVWCIDGTIVRAHQCAGGAEKRGSRRTRRSRPWPFPRRFLHETPHHLRGRRHAAEHCLEPRADP